MPLVAGMDEQQAIRLGLRVVRGGAPIKQGCDGGRRTVGQIARHGIGKDLGPRGVALGRDDAGVGVAVHVHEAQRREAVEPGVGDLLNDLPLALGGDGGVELFHRIGVFAPRGRGRVDDQRQFRGDLIDQKVARGLREFLEGVGIHQTITFLPAAISAIRVLRSSFTYWSTSASSAR